jgi:hypothetical protein
MDYISLDSLYSTRPENLVMFWIFVCHLETKLISTNVKVIMVP